MSKHYQSVISYQSVKQFGYEQDRCSIGPDLGSNCLQRLSAEDKLLLAREKTSFAMYS